MQISSGRPALEVSPEFEDHLRQYGGRPVLAGAGPEALHPSIEAPAEPHFQGVVEITESTASEVFLRISSSAGELVVTATGGLGVGPGGGIHVRVPGVGLHVFDADNLLHLG